MKMKKCPRCKGEGFIMIEETPEECPDCDGTGEIESDDEDEDSLFEQMARLVRPFNKYIEQNYSPYKF